MEYWIYENYPNNKAVGHAVTCAHFKMHGGEAPKTGRWHGPFNAKHLAEAAGAGTKRPFHWCSRCY